MKHAIAFAAMALAVMGVTTQAGAQSRPPPARVIVITPPYQPLPPLPERQYMPPPASLAPPMPQAPALPPMLPRS